MTCKTESCYVGAAVDRVFRCNLCCIFVQLRRLDAYDALVSSGLLDKIIEMIGVDYGDMVAMFEETLSARISFTNSMSNRLSALFGILENVFKEATPEQLDYLRKLADVKDGDNSTVKKAD